MHILQLVWHFVSEYWKIRLSISWVAAMVAYVFFALLRFVFGLEVSFEAGMAVLGVIGIFTYIVTYLVLLLESQDEESS